MINPEPSDSKKLLKGEKKFTNNNIGKIVSDTNIILPEIAILCFTPQQSHLIGLYTQPQNDLNI